MSASKELFMEIRQSEMDLLNFDKASIRDISGEITRKVADGELDGLEVLITAKKGKELFDQIEKGVRPHAESQTRLSRGETLKKYNTEVVEKETGVTHDFSNCNDSEWNDLKRQLELIEQKMKDREKFLKVLTKPHADLETGEIINPPIRTGKLGLALTLR